MIVDLAIFIIAIGFYSVFVEPYWIKKTRLSLDLGKSGKKIRVVLISDLHLSLLKGSRFLTKIVEAVNLEQPAIVLMAGDFVEDSDKYISGLSKFKNLNGVKLAVLGNHDYAIKTEEITSNFNRDLGEKVCTALTQAGVKVLKNQSYTFENIVDILGLEELWTGQADLKKAYSSVSESPHPKILLVHNPDEANLISVEKINVVMAGHTHAGQIRLPLIGPIGRIPTKLGQHYDKGFFKVGGHDLFISSGLGESGLQVRSFNRPEVVIFEINL